jgi:hypothetical protein
VVEAFCAASRTSLVFSASRTPSALSSVAAHAALADCAAKLAAPRRKSKQGAQDEGPSKAHDVHM